MRLVFDLTTRALTLVDGLVKTTSREPLRIDLLDDGAATTLDTGETLTLKIRAAGITDGDLITLQEVDEADYNTTAEAYITTFSARTQPALDLLQINDGDTTNDVAEPVDIELVLIFTDVDTNETESATALTQLSRSLSLPGDTDPDTIPTHKWQLSADGNYIEYLIDGAVIGKVPLITT